MSKLVQLGSNTNKADSEIKVIEATGYKCVSVVWTGGQYAGLFNETAEIEKEVVLDDEPATPAVKGTKRTKKG